MEMMPVICYIFLSYDRSTSRLSAGHHECTPALEVQGLFFFFPGTDAINVDVHVVLAMALY